MQFGRGCHLWDRDCPSPSGSGCHPPASLSPAGDGLVCSRLTLVWYSLSPWFCEQAKLCLRLELFVGKFSLSLFFSLFLTIPQFALLFHISSLRLSSGHSDMVLTLSMQSAPPCPATARWWWTQVFGLLLCWQLQFGAYSVFFFFFFFLFPPGYVAF